MEYPVIDVKCGTELGKTRFIKVADEILGALCIVDYDNTKPADDMNRFIAAPLIPISKTANDALTSKLFYGNRDQIHHFSKNTNVHRNINGSRHTLHCEATHKPYKSETEALKDLAHLKNPLAFDIYKMKNEIWRICIRYWKPNPSKAQMFYPAGRTLFEAISAPLGEGAAHITFMHEGEPSIIITEVVKVKDIKKSDLKRLNARHPKPTIKNGLASITYHKLEGLIYKSDNIGARQSKNMDLFGDILFSLDEDEGTGLAMNPDKR